jgi:hypothetical protein
MQSRYKSNRRNPNHRSGKPSIPLPGRGACGFIGQLRFHSQATGDFDEKQLRRNMNSLWRQLTVVSSLLTSISIAVCRGGSGSSVSRTTHTITWAAPASIVAGAVLSSTQLDATANVAGTFVYSPPAGTVESTAGTVTLSVTFTPTDTTDYNTATVSLIVTSETSTATVDFDTAEQTIRALESPKPGMGRCRTPRSRHCMEWAAAIWA